MGRLGLIGVAAIALFGLRGAAGAADQAKEVPAAATELLTKDIQVSADGSSVMTIHAELRAENDAGALQIAQISVPFISSLQELEIVEAHTLKPDGTKIPINVGSIYEQIPQNASQLAMITDLRVKILLFPQFAAGDTAVYTIRLKSPHPLIANQFLYGDVFVRAGSYKEVRETITAPKSMNLRSEAHDVELSRRNDGENSVITVHYSAPHPAAEEPVEVSPIDHEPRFFVSSFQDYAALGRAYGALSEPKIAVTPHVQALADQITSQVTDRREQAKKLYEWVARNIRYVGIELGTGSLIPHDVDAILANGYGDCKDHDVLLQALLKAKGISAESVLINSGNAYTLTDVPTFAQINHVITRLPEFDLYLDSSLSMTPFGILPLDEYGKPDVRVSATGATFATVPLLAPGTDTVTTTTVQHLSADGVLSGTTKTTASGPTSIVLRLVGLGVQALGGENAAAQQLAARGFKGATGKLSGDPPLELSPGYTVNGDFTSPGWTDWLSGATTYVMPGGLRVLGLSGDGVMGPFYPGDLKDSEPTPCFSGQRSETISLEAPPNVAFSSIPKDTKIETPNLLFTAHWTVTGNTLSVHREFTSHIDKPLCTGAVRKRTAEALKQIADSYDAQISLGSGSQPSQAANDAANAARGDDDTYDKANDLIRKGDLKQGIQMLTDLLASGHPLSVDTLYGIRWSRAAAYLQDSQPAKAIDDATEAIRLKPDANMNLYRIRARANFMLGKKKLAADDLTVVLKQSPDDLATRQLHASLSEMAGDYDAAAEDYNYLVKARPDDVSLVVDRARLRLNARMYDEAAADFERAAKLGLPEDQVLDGLCHVLPHTDRLGEATYQCSRALGLHEYDGSLLEARGYAYFRLGKYAEALRDFDKAATTYPQDARYLYERGVTKSKMGDAAGGKHDMDAARKAKSDVARTIPPKMRS